MVRNQFSSFLRQERRGRGWSQKNLAEELKVARVTIARWELGMSTPSLYWRRQICELFHKQIEELFPETHFPVDATDIPVSQDFPSGREGDSTLTHTFSQITQESWKETEGAVQQISVEKSRLELQEKRLEIQKKIIEYTITIANKMIVDILDPQCDMKIRSYAIEELLLNHQYTNETNSQEILLPTMGDVRKALEIAKRYAENDEKSHDTALEYSALHLGRLADRQPIPPPSVSPSSGLSPVSELRGTGLRLDTLGEHGLFASRPKWRAEYPEYQHTLLAIAGGQPQIITFTLDLLLQQNIPISEVNIVHPATEQNTRMERSIQLLQNEFHGDRYRDEQTIHLRNHVLHHNGQPLANINDEASTDDVLNTMHNIIRNLKERHCIVHFSITGGRRLTSILSMSAAILNLDHEDHMWHIYTPDHVLARTKEGALMHIEPHEGVRLIEVPLARLSADARSQFSAPSSPEASPPSARDILRIQEEQAEASELARREKVIAQLTLRQREVLKAFANGFHPSEVAAFLSISAPTVSTHTTVLLALCREAWSIPAKERLDYRFLQLKFAKYF